MIHAAFLYLNSILCLVSICFAFFYFGMMVMILYVGGFVVFNEKMNLVLAYFWIMYDDGVIVCYRN